MSESTSDKSQSIYSSYPLQSSASTKNGRLLRDSKSSLPSAESSQTIPNRRHKFISSLRRGVSDISHSIYSNLPPSMTESAKTTRLLRILPGYGSEPITCELTVVDLARNPKFEALSYVWGDSTPPDYIYCRGQRKSVTPNLGAALRRLRYPNKERIMWIDAICVNQADLKERSQQVRLMRDIYSQAWQVVVWLGEDYNGYAAVALDTLRNAFDLLLTQIGIDPVQCRPRHGDDVEYIRKKIVSESDFAYKNQNNGVLPPFPESPDATCPLEWQAVAWFYDREWFSRIWVVQEVAFSPVVVYIGSCEVDWITVGLVSSWLWLKGFNNTEREFNNLTRADLIFNVRSRMDLSVRLIELLPLYKGMNATDPRDKVYALFGLLRESSLVESLEPDYSQNVVHVYGSTLRSLLQKEVSHEKNNFNDATEAFSFCIASFQEFDDSFPSWVPRWDKTERFGTLSSKFSEPSQFSWCADGERAGEILESEAQSILTVRGLKISTIKSVFHEVKELFVVAKEVLGQHMSEAGIATSFIRTITAGNWEGPYPNAKLFNAAYLKQNLSSESRPMVGDFFPRVNVKAGFFITDDNCMGIGCKYIQPGDWICILFGVRVPVILRPMGDRYRFMELCYVDQLMKGEAMRELKAGRLSEEWLTMR